MKVLLDTCSFLWVVTGSAKLSPVARREYESPDNEVLLSAASAWEIAVKYRLGGYIAISGDPEVAVPEAMGKHRIGGLPVRHDHALRVARLPLHHRDPFDRLLVAQCEIESAVLLTPDPLFAPYGITVCW